MKKKRLLSLVALLLCGLVCLGPGAALGATAQAAQAPGAVDIAAQLQPEVTIVIDGTPRSFFNVQGRQVHPILYQGTTYLPVRAIGELMGKNVDWNQDTKTVTLAGARTTPATVGTLDKNPQSRKITASLRRDFTVIVEGAVRTFRDAKGTVVYPLLYSGSTYLPVRAIGELMGKSVGWNGATKTVTLTQEGDVTDADTFGPSPSPAPTATPAPPATLEAAKSAALAHAGLTAGEVTFTKTKLDWDDGKRVYEIEFYTANGREYEYEIDPATGKVLSFSIDGGPAQTPAPTPSTALEAAKSAALAHAGLTAGEVTFTKTKLDWDDGNRVYKIEFYTADGREYEYEIDPATGAVLSFDIDGRPSAPSTGSITREQAQAIALGQVPGAAVGHITRCKHDWNHGCGTYEIEIIYGSFEYEIEVDSATGQVLCFHREHHNGWHHDGHH